MLKAATRYAPLGLAFVGGYHVIRYPLSPVVCENKQESWLPDIELPKFEEPKFLTEVNVSLKSYYELLSKFYSELSGDEDSLLKQISEHERLDRELHPELGWKASVRLSSDLCQDEETFLSARKKRMRKAFARFIQVNESEVDVRDVPILGIACSGGGMRAAVNTIGSLTRAHKTGILDCTTFIAGISGSTWPMSILYGLSQGSIAHLGQHFTCRITKDFFNPETMELLTQSPTNRYLLSGAINKYASPHSDELTLVDAYGVLLSTRLYIPAEESKLDPKDLNLSEQKRFFTNGEMPLPIYSAVRHDIPKPKSKQNDTPESSATDKSDSKPESASAPQSEEQEGYSQDEAEEALKHSKWQWVEMTPFEVGVEEIGAFIPTWSLGRKFANGEEEGERTPELPLTLLSGVFASAFCATLQHYYKEIKPLIKTFPYAKEVDDFVRQYEDPLSSIHPFPPTSYPNPFKGLQDRFRKGGAASLAEEENLSLMDAGAYCNVPYTPLFRRGCDVIIALDASADSQELWFERAKEAAARYKLVSWPEIATSSLFPQENADTKLDEAAQQADDNELDRTDRDDSHKLGKVNVWIGSTKKQHQDVPTRILKKDNMEKEAMERDGLALIYLPLKADYKVEEVWSTWKFEYTKEETERLLKTAENNFQVEEMRHCLKGVWKRKKQLRENGASQ